MPKWRAGEGAGHAVTAVLAGTFARGIPVGTLIGAAYAQRFLHLSAAELPWLAAGILALTTVVNLRGIRLASLINSASVVALITLVVLIVVSNPRFGLIGLTVAGRALTGQTSVSYGSVWTVCSLLFWAYLGWENLSFGLEELKHPEKSIPRACTG